MQLSDLSFARYLVKKEKARPIFLIWEVTNRCNSRCVTCFNWDKVMDVRKRELDLKQLEKVTKTMKTHLLALALTGGEPFIREDLVDGLKIFYKNTKMNFLTIPTNAIHTDYILEQTKKILDFFPGHLTIDISIDGIGPMHDKIRGVKGNFKQSVKTFNGLMKLKEKHKNLSVGVNTCINSVNQDSFIDIYKYIKEHFKGLDQHNFEVMRGSGKDPHVKGPPIKWVMKHLKTIKAVLESYDYHNTGLTQRFLKAAKLRYHDVVAEHMKEGGEWLPCTAGKLAAYIDCDGNLFPCELYRPIGNLADFDYDFDKIWTSEKASEIRKEIYDIKCKCTHACFQYMNVLFTPSEYPKIVKYMITK